MLLTLKIIELLSLNKRHRSCFGIAEPLDTSGKHSRLSYSNSWAQKLVTLAQASEKSFLSSQNELRETSLLKRGRNWDFIDIRKKNNDSTKAAMVAWAY